MQQNLFFCEKCNLLTDGVVCRQCGGKTRVPLQSDLCFFAEFGWQSYRMFSEALTSAEIDYVAEPVYGGFSRLNKPRRNRRRRRRTGRVYCGRKCPITAFVRVLRVRNCGNRAQKRRRNQVGSCACIRRYIPAHAQVHQGTNRRGSQLSRKVFRHRNYNVTLKSEGQIALLFF